MKVYEFQAKHILKGYNICLPRGRVVNQSRDAREAFREIGKGQCAVKAQVLAGGRGKGGGIRFVNTAEECQDSVSHMLGTYLITPQTGEKGAKINYVLIEEAVSIQRELYLAITIDRSLQTLVLIASGEGGMDIEEIARKTPENIIKEPVDIFFGILPFQARRIAARLQISGSTAKKLQYFMVNLFHAFINNDCSLIEINPLAITTDNGVCALDTKMDIDDNAIYRHPELEQMTSEDYDIPAAELLARKYRLSYVSLDGNIGCLVNGAGLAMATMDIIKLHGGEPANFLDVGGDATLEQVTQAIRILLSDQRVRVILVNIFGGIMKCDIIANGIVQAVKEVNTHIPMVVRLEGTNVDIANRILEQSGLKILSASNMREAAELAVSKAM